MIIRNRPSVAAFLLVALASLHAPGASAQDKPVPFFSYDGRTGMSYQSDAKGNRVPDFSYAGYMGGNAPIPDANVLVTVAPAEGDDGPRIQAALDYAAAQPLGANGLRGAVLLVPGEYQVAGQLMMNASGVVLRGSGPDEDGTKIIATGNDRRNLIRVLGIGDSRLIENDKHNVAQSYVPVNAMKLELDSVANLAAGQRIVINHPSTNEWLTSLEMDRTNYKGHLDWRPGFYDINFDRTISAIDGKIVTLDAPLTMALDRSLATATVTPYEWPGRISNVGIENLQLVSEYDTTHPMDEEHAWMGVVMENAENAWVRNVTGRHFVSSVVCIWESCRAITVADCKSLEPVSEIAGYRRHTFHTAGSQTLFLRCFAEEGIHDFSTGWLAAGPNAFVDCDTARSHDFSGPIESWATGVLYDGCDIDGGGLVLGNRERHYAGVGWAAGNSLLHNCTAANIMVYDPPGDAQNWAMGCWGLFYGRGIYYEQNSFVNPDSIYVQQLTDRLNKAKADHIIASAAMPSSIESSGREEPLSIDFIGVRNNTAPIPSHPLVLDNGWLTIDGKLVVGRKTGVMWWRGHVMPSLNKRDFGIGVTRFVPGRDGRGFTDDLDELTDELLASSIVALEHNMGLWYDRRQDDHQMVRRPDGEVWPPFYEVPWARSGVGTNWLGISKYDLTKFNPWYFSRLREFADLGEQKGLILLNQHYFQHNILEAGAHWANYAWRPANNINNTSFPEPPEYENRKRVFMSKYFYDETDAVNRPLHEAFIRHHLENFAGAPNVIHLIGAEFTGPEHFARLWVRTIRDWQAGHGAEQLIAISTTKDVQDAILADPELAPTIDVINIVSWHYAKGGESLAPRQHQRSGIPRPDIDMNEQIREYRKLYPDKAVIGDFGRDDGWPVIFGGGSLAAIRPLRDDAVLAAIPAMRPWQPEGGFKGGEVWALADPGRDYLLWLRGGSSATLDLTGIDGMFKAQWIDPDSGAVTSETGTISGGGPVTLSPPKTGFQIVWLNRQ